MLCLSLLLFLFVYLCSLKQRDIDIQTKAKKLMMLSARELQNGVLCIVSRNIILQVSLSIRNVLSIVNIKTV